MIKERKFKRDGYIITELIETHKIDDQFTLELKTELKFFDVETALKGIIMPRCPSCDDYLNVPEAGEKGLCEQCEDDKQFYDEVEKKKRKQGKEPNKSRWSDDMLSFLKKLKGK